MSSTKTHNFKFPFPSTDPFTKSFSPGLLRCYRSVLFIFNTPKNGDRWNQFLEDVRYYMTKPPRSPFRLVRVNLSKVEEERDDMDMSYLNNSYGDDVFNYYGGRIIVSNKPYRCFLQKFTIFSL